MILPCTTCKYRKERKRGHRVFVGCKDKSREKELKEVFENYYKCSNYEEDDTL